MGAVINLIHMNNQSNTTNNFFNGLASVNRTQHLTREQYVDLFIWIGFTLPLLYAAAFGNGLTLAVIIRDRWWKSGIQILIASLTLADFLGSLLFRPQQAVNIVLGQTYPWTIPTVCRLAGYASMCFSYVTPLHCCMIAINRLFAIVLRRHGLIITSRCAGLIMAAVSWLMPIVLFSLPLAEVDGFFASSRPYGHCSWIGPMSSSALSYSISFGMVYVPVFVILICYATIFLHLRIQERVIQPHTSGYENNRDGLNMGRRVARRWQVAKMMLVTFIVFAVSYIPTTTFFYLVTDIYAAPFPTVLAVFILILWSSSFWNPVVYFGMNQEFRESYKEMLSRCSINRYCNPPNMPAEYRRKIRTIRTLSETKG